MVKCSEEGCEKSNPKFDKEDGMRTILNNNQIRFNRWLVGKWRCEEHNNPDADDGEESPYLLSPELSQADILEHEQIKPSQMAQTGSQTSPENIDTDTDSCSDPPQADILEHEQIKPSQMAQTGSQTSPENIDTDTDSCSDPPQADILEHEQIKPSQMAQTGSQTSPENIDTDTDSCSDPPQVDVLENSKTENEGHEETNDEPSHLREMPNTRTSDKEWLNEEVYEEVDYQPVRKKPTYRTINREIQSPPQRPEKYRVVQHHNDTKPPPQRVVVNSPKKDDYSVFCEYIGDRLRKFKKPQTRSNLQQLISTILWQAEYGHYDNIENVKRVLLFSVQGMEVVQAVEQPVNEETIPEGDQTDLIEN